MSAVIAVAAIAGSAAAQCDLLIRESFRPGDRPHGGNGQLRNAQIHNTLGGYWPQIPNDGTQWITSNASGTPSWAFAGSSLDPVEMDALDPFNGTAFGEAPAAALLPFHAPAGSFTTSAEVVQVLGSTSATYLGYTSSPATQSNFETFGTLWMSLNGSGEWAIYQNGSSVVAAGVAPIAGSVDSGWLHMEFTFDPASSTVSGRVMSTAIPATPVALTRPLAYFGMEAYESWNVVNNISVSRGTAVTATATGGGAVCRAGTATFTAATNVLGSSGIWWSRSDGWPLSDGSQADGSVVSGARTTTLTVSNAAAGAEGSSGQYFCIVAGECGNVQSNRVSLTVNGCAADYDCSGTLNVQDIFGYLSGFFAGDVRADFDQSATIEVADVFAFLNAWFAGC